MKDDFIVEIINTPTPSGYEYPMQDVVYKYCRSKSEIHIDGMGNMICCINSQATKKIAFEAHCDEVGMIVHYISAEGYIYFHLLGGMDILILRGLRVDINTRHGIIPGVIGVKPPILMHNNRNESISLSDLWIDCGLSSDQVHDWVKVGDVVTFHHDSFITKNGMIVGAGIDNKISVMALLASIVEADFEKLPLDIGFYFCFTVQEEMGMRGVVPCITSIKPDVVISLDTVFTSDVPSVSSMQIGDIKLGQGIVLSYSPENSYKLNDKIAEWAIKYDISFQRYTNLLPTKGVNSSVIQYLLNGVKTVQLLTPCRNMHSPVEICCDKDCEALQKILCILIEKSKDLITA